MKPCRITEGGGAMFSDDLWRCATCGREKYPEVFTCPMATFGANQHMPIYVGGGDLWGEPDKPLWSWWRRLLYSLGICWW